MGAQFERAGDYEPSAPFSIEEVVATLCDSAELCHEATVKDPYPQKPNRKHYRPFHGLVRNPPRINSAVQVTDTRKTRRAKPESLGQEWKTFPLIQSMQISRTGFEYKMPSIKNGRFDDGEQNANSDGLFCFSQ